MTKITEVIAEKPFQNSGVTRRLDVLIDARLEYILLVFYVLMLLLNFCVICSRLTIYAAAVACEDDDLVQAHTSFNGHLSR